jgi:hypothetical protein
MKTSPHEKIEKVNFTLLVIGVVMAAGLTAVAYLIFALVTTPFGFPLDDAWIHQVFARNIAKYAEFSYNPGQVVAGSTSPLWTLLLVPSYWFGEGFYLWWAYGLGILFLILAALEVYRLYLILFPTAKPLWAVVAALLLVFEWRMTWASVSGMEVTLFIFGTLWLLRLYLEISLKEKLSRSETRYIRPYHYLILGLIGGGITLVRPEGLVLFGLVGLDVLRRAFMDKYGWQWLAIRWLMLGVAALVFVTPYLIFNYLTGNSLLPNTFGAKVGYYGNAFSIGGILDYLGQVFSLLLRSLLAIVPGLLFILADMFRKPRQYQWLPLWWAIVLLLVYAVRLPVLYHEGRYVMPLIPILILYGVHGSERVLNLFRHTNMPLLSRILPVLGIALIAYSWFNGAFTYRFDVKYINDEQVTVAKWLRDNTPQNAVVATHDIGAIRYFSERKLIDTAGLVNPEFVPVVRDETAILAKAKASGATYFALLPTWYPRINAELEKAGQKVFQPQETYLAQFGEQNMAVFRLTER